MSIRTIGVIGQGVSLQVICAWLNRTLSPFGVGLLGFETDSDNAPAVVEWGPELSHFCRVTGISLAELMSRCQGSFSWGTRCEWLQRGKFIPYGDYGLNPAQQEFEHGLMRWMAHHPQSLLDEFSLAAQAAAAGKFALAGPGQIQWQQAMRHGVVLDDGAMTGFLREHNLKAGCRFQSLRCRSGTETDWLSGTQNAAQVDFWLHCNQATPTCDQSVQLVEQSVTHAPEPYSHLSAKQREMRKTCRLTSASVEYTWAIKAGQKTATQTADGVRLISQHRDFAVRWQDDHLEMSLPYFGPVISPYDVLIHWLERLLDVWPAGLPSPATARHYELYTRTYLDELNEFNRVLLGEPSSQQALFARSGRLLASETNAVNTTQWFSVLMGRGVSPQRTSVVLESTEDKVLFGILHQLAGQIKKLAESMPEHEVFRSHFCAVRQQ